MANLSPHPTKNNTELARVNGAHWKVAPDQNLFIIAPTGTERMVGLIPELKTNGLSVVFRPSAFIQAQVDEYGSRRVTRAIVGLRLTAFYLGNLLLYAGPLTLSGFGSPLIEMPPANVFVALVSPVSAAPAVTWQFALTLLQNSAYLLVISGVTLITFHLGVWVTRNARGLLQSVHTVVFSTGIYLAALFTLTWYLSTAEAIAVADDFLIAVQKSFVYYFIDLFGASIGLPGGRPEGFSLAGITTQGRLSLVGLGLALLYYLYSLYLGARINHQTSRLDAFIAVGFVSISPALYVAGSIMVYTLQ